MKPRELFKARGYTVSAVAEMAKVSRSAVSQWDRVPAERVLDIEAGSESRLTRYDMRPDLYPRRPA